jgi:hypothetical protein
LNLDDDWTLAQTLFGVTTFYRREEDGSLSIKMEGRLEGVPLFDQVAVLREVDLHYRWAPFVSSSLTIAHLDKLDTVGWFVVGLPSFGLMRDACFRSIGCDSIYEDGSVLLVAQGIADKSKDGVKNTSLKTSVGKSSNGRETDTTTQQSQTEDDDFQFLSNDPVLNELDLPAPPTRMGSGRMTIRTFQAIIHIESPTQARTCMIANLDPNLPLIPQSLLDFLMKKLCGVLLSKLQHAAKKVSKDPINNPHASMMRREEDFYKGWLMEKFKGVAKIRGWNMPPVSAFELTDPQLELAEAADAKNLKGKTTKTIKFYHSLSEDKLGGFLETNDSARSEPALVGQPSPKVRTLSGDSDGISELSRNSSSTFSALWRSNPLVVYLGDVEDKTRLRKDREIEKSRDRAANRLKPKLLDEESQSRLDELLAARERRVVGMKAGQKLVMPENATKAQRNLLKTQHKRDWATMWTTHGLVTRIIVVLSLVASLFGLLYMDTIFEQYTANRHGTWWMGRRRDGATILYMSLSASVHFFLSYVSLMYAFSSLQLGSIAGSQAKKFYSKNVHLIVGVLSGSMLLIGMLKAASMIIFRWMVWRAALLSGSLKSSLYFPSVSNSITTLVPESLESSAAAVGSLLNDARSIFGTGYQFVGGLVAMLLSNIQAVLLESNIIGRSLSSGFGALIRFMVLPIGLWNDFVDEAVGHYEGRYEVPSWREDAYATTRALLAYSGIFLLVLLMLFNLSAKKARSRGEIRDSDDALSVDDSSVNSKPTSTASTASDPPVLQTSSTDASDSSRVSAPETATRSRKLTRSLSPRFDTIEEASDEGDETAAPQGNDGPRSCGSPTKKKRRAWFFRARKGSKVEARGRSEGTDKLHASSSM